SKYISIVTRRDYSVILPVRLYYFIYMESKFACFRSLLLYMHKKRMTMEKMKMMTAIRILMITVTIVLLLSLFQKMLHGVKV
ncbi:MAG: hypothetical protein WBP83_10220, partial [Nitrososphaeraceae archaeon]